MYIVSCQWFVGKAKVALDRWEVVGSQFWVNVEVCNINITCSPTPKEKKTQYNTIQHKTIHITLYIHVYKAGWDTALFELVVHNQNMYNHVHRWHHSGSTWRFSRLIFCLARMTSSMYTIIHDYFTGGSCRYGQQTLKGLYLLGIYVSIYLCKNWTSDANGYRQLTKLDLWHINTH